MLFSVRLGTIRDIFVSQQTCCVSRSAILKDVATSSARNRPQLTKTLLVLGEWVKYIHIIVDPI